MAKPSKPMSLLDRAVQAVSGRPAADVIRERLAQRRADQWQVYRDTCTKQADGLVLDPTEVDELTAVMVALNIMPAELEADVAAIKSHSESRRRHDALDYDALAAESKAAAEEIQRLLHKRLPELRGIVATAQARIQSKVGLLMAINDAERTAWRIFATDPAARSIVENAHRAAAALEAHRRSAVAAT